MAQIAIPLVVMGALYLMSNDKPAEGFVTLQQEEEKQEPEATPQQEGVRYKYDTSKHVMNNEGNYSQYQDKYFNSGANQKDPLFQNVADATFVSLNGSTVPNREVSHNNMTSFYGSKSYGALPGNDYKNARLDAYSGDGSLSIEKKEVGAMFRPEQNIQNVYGNQNQNDFLESRVNPSMRQANTTPWAKIQDTKGELGFNWAMADRDKSMPKSVDDLRAANKPKANCPLNYTAPAYDPKQVAPSVQQLGQIIQKSPQKYHVNTEAEMLRNPGGMAKERIAPDQMLTREQRDTTNVEYYGARGVDDIGYMNRGEEGFVHKQSLGTDTMINLKGNQMPHSNYGKNGYKSYVNNRENDGYFGAFQGAFLANVIDPLVKTLRHTKKKGQETPLTNMKGANQQMVFNPQQQMPVTNREMVTEKIGMNHLTVERQDGSGYKVANPYLPATQRPSTNREVFGQANGGDKQRSYGAEYNQRNIDKPYENRIPNGNAKHYQTEGNYSLVNKVQTQQYSNLAVRPSIPQVQMYGEQTKNVATYENIAESYNHSDLLKAFKSNPYTQPLGSVA
jgi:hypothetical protein